MSHWAVVVNDEGQHSVWEMARPVPDGWTVEQSFKSQEQCLEWIEQVWTDITPASARREDGTDARE